MEKRVFNKDIVKKGKLIYPNEMYEYQGYVYQFFCYLGMLNPAFLNVLGGDDELWLERLYNSGIRNIEGANYPEFALTYMEKVIGYTTKYLKNYVHLDEKIKTMGINNRIRLFIMTSKILEQIHNTGVRHGDIHSQNIMTNGNDISFIDFNNCALASEMSESAFNGLLKKERGDFATYAFQTIFGDAALDNDNQNTPLILQEFMEEVKHGDSAYPHEILNDMKDYQYDSEKKLYLK